MATAQTIPFSGLRVLIGDGASTEVFAAPCGFTERSLSLSKELGSTNVPDCTDEDKASWTERDVIAKSAEISGQGVLDVTSLITWQGRFTSDVSFNVRIEVWRAAVKTGHWAGRFHIESLEVAGTRGERVTIQVGMQSDGALSWTAGTGP